MMDYWKQGEKKQVTKLPEEWAAESGGDPWQCPQCGCREWHVIDTKHAADGNIDRTRCCNRCKKSGPRIYTTETVYHVTDGGEQITARQRRTMR